MSTVPETPATPAVPETAAPSKEPLSVEDRFYTSANGNNGAGATVSPVQEPPPAEAPPVAEPPSTEKPASPPPKPPSPADTGPPEEKAPKTEKAPEEESGEVEYRYKTGQRIQTLLKRQRELETELAQYKAPKEPTDLKEPVPPDPDTFTGSWEELKAAQKKYTDDLVTYKIALDRKAQADQQQQEYVREFNENLTKIWMKRVAKTLTRAPEYKTLVQENDSGKIKGEVAAKLNSTADQFILESDVGPDILLELAKNPELQDRVYQMTPRQTAIELVRMESKILEAVNAPKNVTKAPPPPTDVVTGVTGVAKIKPLEDIFYK